MLFIIRAVTTCHHLKKLAQANFSFSQEVTDWCVKNMKIPEEDKTIYRLDPKRESLLAVEVHEPIKYPGSLKKAIKIMQGKLRELPVKPAAPAN